MNAACGALKTAALLCAISALSGCGVSTLTSSFGGGGGLFGGSGGGSGNNAPTEGQKVSESNLLSAAQNDAGGQVDTSNPSTECPTVSVAPGDSNITFSAKGGGDSLAVMHRGEITKTARECANSLSGGLSVKYGFAGRVLLGPQGRPGTVTLPVKVTVLDGGRATVKSDLVKVPVTITPDQTAGYFSVTREVVVQIAPGVSPRAYHVIIAFDRRAPGAS